MYSLINPPFMGSRVSPILPMYEYAMNGLRQEVNKVKDYYSQNLFVVDNTHILKRILIDLLHYIKIPPEKMTQAVRSDKLRLYRAYGINSSLYNGGISNGGNIYNRKCPEIYIEMENDFNATLCYKNYQRLKPLRILSHPFSDLNLNFPKGNYVSEEYGYTTIAIDIALLAVQFKAWHDKERYVKEEDLHLPIQHFIVKYVLTNLMDTHVDVCIFNRFSNMLRNKEVPYVSYTLPYTVADFAPKIDHAHKLLIEFFKKSPSSYLQRLNSIPSLEYGSYYRAVNFPDTAVTRNIRWALVLAKLDMLETMLDMDELCGNVTIAQAQRELLARDLRIALNDKSLVMFIPEVDMNRIKAVYGRVSREKP